MKKTKITKIKSENTHSQKAITCQYCGSPMIYGADEVAVSCSGCGNKISIEEYRLLIAEEKKKRVLGLVWEEKDGWKKPLCPHCYAMLDSSMVEKGDFYCPFCGGEVSPYATNDHGKYNEQRRKSLNNPGNGYYKKSAEEEFIDNFGTRKLGNGKVSVSEIIFAFIVIQVFSVLMSLCGLIPIFFVDLIPFTLLLFGMVGVLSKVMKVPNRLFLYLKNTLKKTIWVIFIMCCRFFYYIPYVGILLSMAGLLVTAEILGWFVFTIMCSLKKGKVQLNQL